MEKPREIYLNVKKAMVAFFKFILRWGIVIIIDFG